MIIVDAVTDPDDFLPVFVFRSSTFGVGRTIWNVMSEMGCGWDNF